MRDWRFIYGSEASEVVMDRGGGSHAFGDALADGGAAVHQSARGIHAAPNACVRLRRPDSARLIERQSSQRRAQRIRDLQAHRFDDEIHMEHLS